MAWLFSVRGFRDEGREVSKSSKMVSATVRLVDGGNKKRQKK
jgi:hypothetical protein